MGTAASPRVLVIGLDPYRVPGPWDPEPLAEAIEMGLAKFAEHGVAVETCLIGLDGSDDVGAVVGTRCKPIHGSASLSAVACGTPTTKLNYWSK